MKRIEVRTRTERVALKAPFRISGRTFTHTETVVVELRTDGFSGTGEANGLYYRGETAGTMTGSIESARSAIEAGIGRGGLQTAMPAGGARNAVDCALWALESCCAGKPIWQLANQREPHPLITTRTIAAADAEAMAAEAWALGPVPQLKLKLLGDGADAERLEAVREAAPCAWLMVDANQSLDWDRYLNLLPKLQACDVKLIEQPFPTGHDAWMDALPRPIPVAADESILTAADLPRLVGRFDVVNIKLDKSGGFTEALKIVRRARELQFRLMVGCTLASSLSMAPAFLIGQHCEYCDIDGPLYLLSDCKPGLQYDGGKVSLPDGVWGC